MFTFRLVSLIHSSRPEIVPFSLVSNAQLGAGVSTQYCGIWTGVLPNDSDSKNIFRLDQC
jgi:hypothetical protein